MRNHHVVKSIRDSVVCIVAVWERDKYRLTLFQEEVLLDDKVNV